MCQIIAGFQFFQLLTVNRKIKDVKHYFFKIVIQLVYLSLVKKHQEQISLLIIEEQQNSLHSKYFTLVNSLLKEIEHAIRSLKIN